MSQAARAPKEQSPLERDLETLRLENEELDQQVSLLVKTEHRLTRAQFESERNIARVQALSKFDLAYTPSETPLEVAKRGTQLLTEWFSCDCVAVVVRRAGEVVLLADGLQTIVDAPELVACCLSGEPLVATAEALGWVRGLIETVDGLAVEDDVVVVVVPLGSEGDVLGVLGWSRYNPKASFFTEPPAVRHLPYLKLLATHLQHGLDMARLTRQLVEKSEELADKNARLESSLSQIQEANEQLAYAAKLEAIGRLAGGIAHDFNNLLTVIIANASSSLDELPQEASMRESLSPVLDAAMHARDLTRQLLLFARKTPVRPEELRVDSVVEEFSRIATRIVGEHIHLRIGRDPRVGAVYADRGQLEQALMNLVTNARDAMPTGGTLTIETRPATDEELEQGGVHETGQRFVALSVSDTGVGIDPLLEEKIFEPFFSTKETARATGLGLAIVRSVAEQAKGKVLVSSEPGRGTRFTLLLPEASQPQRRVSVQTKLVTILLVEDEDAIRDTVRRVLVRQGYDVVEARSGKEAIRAFRENPHVHILLTDVVMPDLLGPDVAIELRKVRADLPVLYMSGYTFDLLDTAHFCESESFIQKPFTPQQLVHAIQLALAARR
ncbi:MAG: ATP-binding protein [Polyangiaceae bacterium]